MRGAPAPEPGAHKLATTEGISVTDVSLGQGSITWLCRSFPGLLTRRRRFRDQMSKRGANY